jgi:hypothetical protein
MALCVSDYMAVKGAAGAAAESLTACLKQKTAGWIDRFGYTDESAFAEPATNFAHNPLDAPDQANQTRIRTYIHGVSISSCSKAMSAPLTSRSASATAVVGALMR